MITLIYAAIVTAISAILLKITKRPKDEAESSGKGKIKRAAAIIVSVMLFLSIPVVMFANQAVDELWFRFNDKRIAAVEEIYGFRVDDGIKLKRYERLSWHDGADHRLTFECTMSGSEFFEKYMEGSMLSYSEGEYDYFNDGEEVTRYERDAADDRNESDYLFRRSDGAEIKACFTRKKDGSGYECMMPFHQDRDVET